MNSLFINSDEKYVQKYALNFNFKQVVHIPKKSMYIKNTSQGFIVIESLHGSKYVNFFLNKKQKNFKKSDLLLGIINHTAVAWEAENE